jgi:DNA helicase HerA-like ATPase
MNSVSEPGTLFIGFSDKAETLRLDRTNRHGLVAGATGTGKTVTLQILAQALSDAGVPVFAADVKGDLSGISQPGAPNEKMLARAQGMNLTLTPDAPPTVFWDLFGEKGHPVRATVSEMGPLLLSRMLELNDVQEGVLNIVFKVADAEGLLLLDLKDLQAALKVRRREREEHRRRIRQRLGRHRRHHSARPADPGDPGRGQSVRRAGA